MLNSKTVSSGNIIAKLYRDNPNFDSVNNSDLIEWIGEAIEFIAAPMAYEEKVVVVEISNDRAKLPCDLHAVQSISIYPCLISETDCPDPIEKNLFTQMRYSTDVYHMYCKGADFADNCSSDYTYKLNDGYIFANHDEGYVMISYWAIPTDDKGWPKIPDNIRYREGVTTHLAWKLARGAWTRGKMSRDMYMDYARERDWYIGSAGNAARILSIDQQESLKNQLVRMIPKLNEHSQGFLETGAEQVRYKHTNRT